VLTEPDRQPVTDRITVKPAAPALRASARACAVLLNRSRTLIRPALATMPAWSLRGAVALRNRRSEGRARTAIGVTALVVGTAAVLVLLSSPGTERPALAQTPLPTPSLPAGLDTWTTAARADLEATQFQLAEVARGVGAWGGVPQNDRTPAVAADYNRLQSAEGNLRQQEKLIATELATADRDQTAAVALDTALVRLAASRTAAHPAGEDAVRGDCLRLERDFSAVNNQVRVFVRQTLPNPGDISTANLADVIVGASMTPGPAGTGNGVTVAGGSSRKTPTTKSAPNWPDQLNQVAPFINQLLGH
jgi:hypothetical protein